MTSTHTARPPRPMNHDREPLNWPLMAPAALGDDARLLYGGGRQRTLDRNWFDRRERNRYLTPEEKEAYVPTDRDLAAVAEIEAARLGSYRPEYRNLYLSAVADGYTVAEGRGSQFIRVSLFDDHHEDGQLLAVLVGADLESRDQRSGGMPEVSVRARHDTATDHEHDASSTALFVVRNPTMPVFSGYGHATFLGVLGDVRLYDLGVDPLTAADGHERFDPSELCETCDEPHPYAPFLPPERPELAGRLVKVELLPLRPYLVAAE